MAKRKTGGKRRKQRKTATLGAEEQAQLQVLLDRISLQAPENEGFSAFVESLRPLVTETTPLALALAEELGRLEKPVSVLILQAMEDWGDKRLRRAVRKSLFRLRQKELVPEAAAGDEPARVLVPAPRDRKAEAWLSWPDAAMVQVLVIEVPSFGPGYDLAIAAVDHRGGLADFHLLRAAKKRAREFLQQFETTVPGGLVPIPLSHGRFLLQEAATVHRRANKPLPQGYDDINSRFAAWAAKIDEPHVYQLIPAEEVEREISLLRAAASLLDQPPMRDWRLPPEVVQPVAAKIQRIEQSALVVSAATKREQKEHVLREGAVEVFDAGWRRTCRRVLEETALVFALQGRSQEARFALAAAVDLRQPLSVLTENSLVLGLLERSVEAVVDFEPRDDPAGPEMEVTESGLLIPKR